MCRLRERRQCFLTRYKLPNRCKRGRVLAGHAGRGERRSQRLSGTNPAAFRRSENAPTDIGRDDSSGALETCILAVLAGATVKRPLAGRRNGFSPGVLRIADPHPSILKGGTPGDAGSIPDPAFHSQARGSHEFIASSVLPLRRPSLASHLWLQRQKNALVQSMQQGSHGAKK